MTDLSADLGFDQIVLIPRDLGVTIYAEIIIVDPASGDTDTGANSCCDGSVYDGFSIYRDLFVPAEMSSVKMALNTWGRATADYDVFYRDFNTNTLTIGDYADPVPNRRSMVFMHKNLSVGKRSFALDHIGTNREILPARMPK